MGKKHKNLYNLIVDIDNIREAYRKASIGKRSTSGFLIFKEYEAHNINAIREELLDMSYESGKHRVFHIFEPKKRTISALPFRDRIVQHALCNVITPIFENTMLPSSHACRVGKGTHSGARACQSHIRQEIIQHGSAKILKTDFSGYFYNIDRTVLWELIKRKISCKKTLWLISRFLPNEGKGIPIGNLTSQLFANIFGNEVDRFLAQSLKVKRFVRYMDDIVIIHHSRKHLEFVKEYLQYFCENRMKMSFSKSYIKDSTQGIDFLGYRIFEKYKLIRKDSVTRARRKIKRYTLNGDNESLKKFLASFYGHTKHSDSKNLWTNLYKYHEELEHVCKT